MNNQHAITPMRGAQGRYTLRVFELDADGSTEPPAPLPDRQVEAGGLDEARAKAAELLSAERRTMCSLASLAGGAGLVAYVLPPLPDPVPKERKRRRRRR
jgi:hypothetical protein